MIRIAEISFSGNLSKTYDFYTDAHLIKAGQHAICETSRGPSIGKVVKIKEFSERSKECCAWIAFNFDDDTFGSVSDRRIQRATELSDAELKELLG